MELNFTEQLQQGWGLLLEQTDLLYVFVNMLWVFMLSDKGVRSFYKNKQKKKTGWLSKIPKAWYVVFQSLILAALWTYFEDYDTREEYKSIFVSITVSMLAWKLGFEHIVLFIRERFVKQ